MKKSRFKSYAFWVALSSAIVILVQSIATLVGLTIQTSLIENLIMSICGVLVVLGIVTKNEDKSTEMQEEAIDSTNKIDVVDNTTNKDNATKTATILDANIDNNDNSKSINVGSINKNDNTINKTE